MVVIIQRAKIYLQQHPFLIHVFIYAVIFLSLAAVVGKQIALTNDIKVGLITSCQQDINPLISNAKHAARKELHASKNFTRKEWEQFFPNVPKHKLDALIKKSIHQKEQELHSYKKIDCEQRFETTG